MPPDYGSVPPFLTTVTTSHEEEKVLIRRMKERASTYWIPKRYVFSLLVFTACCLTASYNINLSITIVSMVNKSEPAPPNRSMIYDFFGNATNGSDSMHFNWNSEIESCALGAVYYGQLVAMIPGGRMAELYGGKKMLLLCMLVAAVTTLVSPLAAAWNPYAFIVDRMLLGLGTGPVIPIMFHMLGHWIPESERSFHASFILSGYGFGACLGIVVSGALCGTKILYGWPMVFFSGGIFGLLWVLFCAYMMCETPDDHPTISDEEYCHIMSGRGLRGLSRDEQIPNIPWKDMALSVPLWALAIGFFGQYWLLGFFSTVHAVYMGTVLNLPTVKNGELTCIPHLLRAFATIFASYPVDILLERRIVSVGFVRKGATLLNSLVSCAAFYGITLVGRNVTATTLLFMLGGVLGEFVTFGVCMACIDIAPCLSGTVSGVINIIGVIPFCAIPGIVGWLTDYESSIHQWQQVFYITIAIVLLTTFIFLVYGDLRPQPWGVAPELKGQMQRDYEEIRNGSNNIHTAPKKFEDDRLLF